MLWLAWVLLCRDMESACDESVLRHSAADIRRDYSSALLSLAGVRPIRVPLAFGENDVKGRIKGVLRYRRPMTAVALCAVLLAAALTFALAANPARLTLEQIVRQQRNITVVNQTPRNLEFTIRKADLPDDMDFTATGSDSNINCNIPVYEDGTTTIFLKSISYANSSTDYLSAYFDFRYTLPNAGTVLIPYTMDYSYPRGPSFVTGALRPDSALYDSEAIFEDVLSLHSQGPSEQFSIYIPTDVFYAAKNILTFTMVGFNEVVYQKQ